MSDRLGVSEIADRIREAFHEVLAKFMADGMSRQEAIEAIRKAVLEGPRSEWP